MEVGPGCIETEGVAGIWVGPTAPAIPNQTPLVLSTIIQTAQMEWVLWMAEEDTGDCMGSAHLESTAHWVS